MVFGVCLFIVLGCFVLSLAGSLVVIRNLPNQQLYCNSVNFGKFNCITLSRNML